MLLLLRRVVAALCWTNRPATRKSGCRIDVRGRWRCGLTRGFHACAAALPQGDEASPMLWNAIMDMMLQHTKRDTSQYNFVTGWQTKAEVSQIIYADDSTFFKNNTVEAQKTANAMAIFTDFTGLQPGYPERLREVAPGRAQVSGPVDRVSAFHHCLKVTHGQGLGKDNRPC